MATHTQKNDKMQKGKKVTFSCYDNAKNEGRCCHNIARYCSFCSSRNDGGGDF